VGYAGGTKEKPTYHSLGDHTETIEIDFDPSKIAYARLLEHFWACHNPCSTPFSRQYLSAIFVHDEGQKRAVLESKAREEARRGGTIKTEILPYTKFWPAEDYHQKYYLRNDHDLRREFQAIYPAEGDFVASTAVARVNGYLGGNAPASQIRAESDSLGLSPEARKRLLRLGSD
jgi:methionine-S-sulfoxide reductase